MKRAMTLACAVCACAAASVCAEPVLTLDIQTVGVANGGAATTTFDYADVTLPLQITLTNGGHVLVTEIMRSANPEVWTFHIRTQGLSGVDGSGAIITVSGLPGNVTRVWEAGGGFATSVWGIGDTAGWAMTAFGSPDYVLKAQLIPSPGPASLAAVGILAMAARRRR
jgi:hypothetical protein